MGNTNVTTTKEVVETKENVTSEVENKVEDNKSTGNENDESKVEDKETEVESQDDEDLEFTDDEDGDDKEKPSKEELEKRRIYAQQRREREAREKELKQIEEKAYRKALVDAVNGTNPYTYEKIEDDHDIEEYLIMREIEQAGMDPITDYHKYLKQKRKEEKQKATYGTQKLTNEEIKQDAILFQKTYPKVKIDDLQKDEVFLKFSEGKLDVLPLTRVYGDYLDFQKELKKQVDIEAEKKAKRMLAKIKSSPGAINTSGESPEGDFYTIEQIKRMSQNEVSKNFEKVQASLKRHYNNN